MELVLKSQIEHYLNMFMPSNAVFLAERLVAENPCEENRLILATCFHRMGQPKRVTCVLNNCSLPACRYLLALCHYELTNLFEAKRVLMGTGAYLATQSPLACEDELISKKSPIPNGSSGLYLMGCIIRDESGVQHAIEFFQICLKMDPYFWKAYEALCELGAICPPGTYFGKQTCFTDSLKRLEIDGSISYGSENEQSIKKTLQPSAANMAVGKKRKEVEGSDINSENSSDSRRRSGRLAASSVSRCENKTRTNLSTLDVKDGNVVEVKDENSKALSILGSLALAYFQLSQYQCADAVRTLRSLPENQFKSGWVQHQLGRAYFELCKYDEARHAFERMRAIEPHRMQGLEIYSTILWHLQADVDMCFLAQEISTFEKLSGEVWCAVGNCFSRQKDHETAIKYFKRATQVNPRFTYAHTLCGHEYVVNEDFEKATACYRQAILIDPRHYNAWYGLGTIYYRQEKFELAEYHFRRALSINAGSSLLYCYLGMVLMSGKRYDEALENLAKATELQPENPQARFQRANVLIQQEKNEEALVELTKVCDYAPRESSVHFLMGQVCKKMGKISQALAHFAKASHFNPKDNNMIKMVIDRLHETDVDDEAGT